MRRPPHGNLGSQHVCKLRTLGASLVLAGFGLPLLNCSPYDPSLLATLTTQRSPAESACGDGWVGEDELCDTAIADGEPGACPTKCDRGDTCAPQVMIGEDCNRRCLFRFITEMTNGDGCCPEGATPEEDGDCGFCGDSIVGAGETCDPIESCPTPERCTAVDACVTANFSGDPALCTALCEREVIDSCGAGDGCCPRDCSIDSDEDCSAACGDGVVDDQLGETCEPSIAEAECPADCNDDDPCTRDVLIGAAKTCNAACTHLPIAEQHSGDGCCPTGANSSKDSDCPSRCGNRLVEDGEDCDGGERCGDDCRATQITPTATEACLAFSKTDATDECKQCVCERCSELVMDCYDSGDAARDEACSQLAECGNRNECYDISCYCGPGLCWQPRGACKSESEAAAGSTDVNAIASCYNDPNCGTYRARVLGECLTTNCAESCP